MSVDQCIVPASILFELEQTRLIRRNFSFSRSNLIFPLIISLLAMRKLLLSSFFLLFLACKEKQVDRFGANLEPVGFETFRISGIPDENISIKNNVIVIHLPAGFTDDILKPATVLTNDFELPASIGGGFRFQGKEITFALESKTYEARQYTIVVIPDANIALHESAGAYSVTIEKDAKIALPVTVLGTLVTVDSAGNLQREPKIAFVNRADNKSAGEFPAEFASDSTGRMFVKMILPPGFVAGEYTATLKWGKQKAVAPTALRLKFGALFIEETTRSAVIGSEFFSIKGYNISSENKYELLLENDFIESRKIPLNRKSFNELDFVFPSDLPTGSYKSAILVNSVAIVKDQFPFFTEADFHYKEYADQNVLAIVTQPSNKVIPELPRLEYYKPNASVSKTEDLMIFTLKSNNQAERIKLRLINIGTGEMFTLTDTGNLTHIFDAAISFYRFNITKIPTGKYEAYSITGEETPTISGKYYQILHIQ